MRSVRKIQEFWLRISQTGISVEPEDVSGGELTEQIVYLTTYEVLVGLSQLAAPFLSLQ